MNEFVGADVEQVEALARRFEVSSTKLSQLLSASSLGIMLAEWTGADIDRLRSEWNRHARPSIARSAGALSHLANALKAQATQQREASASQGGFTQDRLNNVEEGNRGPAPTSTRGYIDTLRGMNDKEDGLRIQRVVGTDGVSRFVVYIAGTGSASNGTLSAGNNVFAIAGEDANTRKLIEQKIRDATAEYPDAEIMIVGHSQGGMMAQQIADRGVFNVKEVLTYGSPTVTDRNHYGGANVVRLAHNADPVTELAKLAIGGNIVQEIGGELGNFLIGDNRPPKGIERTFSGGDIFNHSGDVHGGRSDYGWLADQFDKSTSSADVSARQGHERFQGDVVEDFK